jgi:hypothetical protein
MLGTEESDKREAATAAVLAAVSENADLCGGGPFPSRPSFFVFAPSREIALLFTAARPACCMGAGHLAFTAFTRHPAPSTHRENTMRKSMLAAVAAVSMISLSSGALAQSAAPLSLAGLARTGADLEDPNDIHGGVIIPTLVLLAIGALIYVLTKSDEPASP